MDESLAQFTQGLLVIVSKFIKPGHVNTVAASIQEYSSHFWAENLHPQQNFERQNAKVKLLEQTVKDLSASLKDKEHEIALLSEYLDELEQKPQPSPSEAFLNKKLSFTDVSTPVLKVRCQNSPSI